jgi:hypothetical protein
VVSDTTKFQNSATRFTMGRIESSSSSPQVQQQPPCSALELAEQLTWKDTFYEHEPDIIAVFDFDQEGVVQYQRNNFFYLALSTGFWLFFAVFYYRVEVESIVAVVIISLLFVVYFALASKAWAKLRAATSSLDGGGIHMAISSVSIRYDQADPMVSFEVSSTEEEELVQERFFFCTRSKCD